MTWQPISTVPKDGTKILLYNKDWYHVEIACWETNEDIPEGWWEVEFDCMDALEPTHWMPFVRPEGAAA